MGKSGGNEKWVHLPQCPITSHNVEFPSPEEKVQEFVALFAKHSGERRKEERKKKNRISEEKSEMYNDPNPENTLSMNSRISIQEVKKTLFFVCFLVCFCYFVCFLFLFLLLVFHLEIIKRLLVWMGYLTTYSIIYQSNGYTYYILSFKSAGKVFGKAPL